MRDRHGSTGIVDTRCAGGTWRAAAMLLLVLGAGCTNGVAAPRPPLAPTRPSGTSTTAAASALSPDRQAAAVLATLPVKGRAPKTGYSRDQFGPAWADVDRNGCDTRNDILARDLTSVTWRPGTHDCVVVAGLLADPYTGGTIRFEKAHAADVQIDHVVALGDAWQTGAQALSATQREQLANDPLNLLAVDGSSNESKSDSDAASWLPPKTAFRCRYVARQVAVKATYGLWVTSAERAVIASILERCPDQPTPTPTPTPTSMAPMVAPSATYPSCDAARAAGAAPIHAGEPGYSAKLDRDGDGTACD